MKNNLHANLTVRIFTDSKCFGPGIATLLHKVEQCHSLRSAAISMGMAYSKAWTILRSCESCLGFKLLCSKTGGKNGGGAVLTEQAHKMLDAYDSYCYELREYADKLFMEKFSFYNSDDKKDRRENLE